MLKKNVSLSIAITLAMSGCTFATNAKDSPNTIQLSANDQLQVFEVQADGSLVAIREFQKGNHNLSISDSASTCGSTFQILDNRVRFNKAMELDNCSKSSDIPFKVYKAGHYQFTLNITDNSLTVKPISNKPKVIEYACPSVGQEPISIDVSKTFEDNSWVRDAYSNKTYQVKNGKITVQTDPQSEGLLLLEQTVDPDSSYLPKPDKTFHWDNATVYFVMTDRFYNGDPDNDFSYGRTQDGEQEIGTFHGGDLAGLTKKLDYIESLGVNAIWITSPLEQIHGWVGGGSNGDFKHYGYHGYYHQDWTKLDANMGTEDELRTFIDTAHAKGIRIIWDVVLNHSGYSTLADMQEFGFGAIYDDEKTRQLLGETWTNWKPAKGQNWHSFNNFIDYSHDTKWDSWWGKGWIRAGIGNYDSPGFNERTMSLAHLPDIKTESEQVVGLPNFYANKPSTKAKSIDRTPREHLVSWLSDWVREYGIDGFRVDTAKHVEFDTWVALKKASVQALKTWKQNNPDKALDNAPFWMTGEVWGQIVAKNDYFDNGFDSLINFEFQDSIAPKSKQCLLKIDSDYQNYTKKINSDASFNVLSYLSSHDTALYWGKHATKISEQKRAASALLLAPGAVQIYYGDEIAREFGATGSDPHQGTRSSFDWNSITGEREQLLTHWKKLGKFRQKHPAIGMGEHITHQQQDYYAFERRYKDDKVLIVELAR